MNKSKINIFYSLAFSLILSLNISYGDYREVELIQEKALTSWPSSIDWFEEEFSKPMVFRQLAKSWQIMELSYEFINKHYPNSKFLFGVDMEEDEKFAICTPDSEEEDIDGFFGERPEGWPFSFATFWDKVKKGEIERYYENVKIEKAPKETSGIPYDLFLYFAQLLKTDKAMPEMFKDATTITLFFSGPRSIRMTHSHESVLLAQIEGRKMVTFIPPDQADKLYVKYCKHGTDYRENGKACVSPVNIQNPDLERFPKCKDINLYQVIVEPGDVIFIPEGWFHEVRALDNSISLSFFYKK